MPSPVDHATSVELDHAPPAPPNVVPFPSQLEDRVSVTPRGRAILAAVKLRRQILALSREDQEELAPMLADLSYLTAKAAVVDDGSLRIDQWARWMVDRVGHIWRDLNPAQRARLNPKLLAIAEGRRHGR